jgi:hypothetical protein
MSEITYIYSIKETQSMDGPLLENIIVGVLLNIKASLGDTEESVDVTVFFPSPKPSAFIPTPSEAQLIEWAKEYMFPTDESYRQYLAEQITY